MSAPPVFRHDAKAFADELTSVLAAAFPAEDPGLEWEAQAQADGLTYTERLERVAFMVAGEQRRVLAATAAVAPEARFPFPGADWTLWSLHGEIATMLQVTGGTAEARLGDAQRLAEVLPRTLGKLRAGELSTSKTIVMLEETVNLDPPEAARVDAEAMKNTRGTRAQFRRRVRRLIAKLDPDALRRKRERARTEQVGVSTYEGEDGLNCISAFAPAEDIALGWAAIEARTKELRAAGDARPVHELRAAAFIDLLVNRPDGTPRVAFQVQVLVPVGTVLGVSDTDAHIPGHGDIPANIAREIAEHAGEMQRSLVDPETAALVDVTSTKYRPRLKKRRVLEPGERGRGGRAHPTHPNCRHRPTAPSCGVNLPGHGPLPADVVAMIATDPEWQRLLTDPDTSDRLDEHPDTYKPGIPLARFIKLRDQHCRFPGCRRPAKQCDIDHTVPHGRLGGLTIRQNLACFCRRHHQIKQLPGWRVVQGDHGELTFTTPTGRIYRTRPPNPDGTEVLI